MDANFEPNRNDASPGLGSAEYRQRLLTKLNCLIAVLEVAIAKITRSMDLPGANTERLLKIRSNLENTLQICTRAKGSLEKALDTPAARKEPTRLLPRVMTYRDYVEMSSIDEYQRFKGLPAISPEDLHKVDFDELSRKLSGS